MWKHPLLGFPSITRKLSKIRKNYQGKENIVLVAYAKEVKRSSDCGGLETARAVYITMEVISHFFTYKAKCILPGLDVM